MIRLKNQDVHDVSNAILDLVLGTINIEIDNKTRNKLLKTINRLIQSIDVTGSPDDFFDSKKKTESDDSDTIDTHFHPLPPLG